MWRRSASYHRKESLCEAPAPEMTLGDSLSAALPQWRYPRKQRRHWEHLVAVLPHHACTISATLTLEVQRCMLRRGECARAPLSSLAATLAARAASFDKTAQCALVRLPRTTPNHSAHRAHEPLITVVTSAPAFPSPYFVSFTVAIASSSSLNRRTERTCDSRRHMGDQIAVTCTSIGTPAASSAMPNTLAGQSELLGRIRVRKSLPSTSLSRSGLL